MDARCQVSDEQCFNKCTRKQRHPASAKHSTMTRASTRRFSCAHPGTAALANELRGSKKKYLQFILYDDVQARFENLIYVIFEPHHLDCG